jgi:hypothetical protein
MSFTAYRLRDAGSLIGTALIEQLGYRQFLWIANLNGFFVWLFRRTYRGRKPPGPFVRAYEPNRTATT